MAQGKRPDVDSFAGLVGWLGLPAESFLMHDEGNEQKREPGTLAIISTHLRASKELSPNAAAALEEIIAAAYRRLRKTR
jgi:hypothetical protein